MSLKTLAPSLLQRSDEIGLEKILLFPHKLSSLWLNREGADLSYPISVELSLTNNCDLSCPWCSDLKLRQTLPDLLTAELLEDLFIDLSLGETRGVTIEGGGEPTLSWLFEIAVEKALKSGLKLGLITNGIRLFGPPLGQDRWAELVSQFQWVRISLDAGDRNNYLALKGRDYFEQVLDNLSKLTNLTPRPTVGVGYVLTNLNDRPDSLLALALRLKKIGVDYLHLRPVVDHAELESQNSADFLANMADNAFAVNLGAMKDNLGKGNDGLPCLAHSLSCVIAADGSVWLCGRRDFDLPAGSLGSLTEQSFKQIWSGPKRLKRVALAAKGEDCLVRCPQCRMTKYNRLLHNLEKIKTRDFI
ncbi:MAG: radical SAM protein [Deltaproteobacteria bacterium]|jgi:MoaA/NifB/PqqE/SkfB family radical SAM enzyme|nr:radical SAM protein [Deltaproteobacteria bacterium]